MGLGHLAQQMSVALPFNGNANDESGNGNDGIVTGPTLSKDRFGVPSRAYSFSSLGDRVTTTNANGFPVSTNDFTVSFWVNVSSGSGTHQIFLCNGATEQFQIDMGPLQNGQTQIGFQTGGTGAGYTPVISWALNQWYNVQVVRFQNTNIIIYRDGVQLSQQTTALGNQSPAEQQDIIMGYRPSPENQFYGILDDIRIYNRPLSDSEVQQLFLFESCSSFQIQSQPAAQEASTGDTVTFGVSVTNGLFLNYQWFFSNSIIAGATSSQLTISNLTATNFGIYSVIVSDSCHSVTSNPDRVWLYADSDGDGLSDFQEVETYHTNPNLWDTDGDGFSDYAEIYAGKNPLDTNSFPAAIFSAFSAIELEFITKTGKVYQVQTSSNLTNWTNLDSPIPGTGTIWNKTYSTRGKPKLFYRIEDVTP